MRAWLIIVYASAVLMTPGCTRLFGGFSPVDKCSSANRSAASALSKAPAWVPGSPARALLPAGCVGGDGTHHPDRLCAVAEVEGVDATETATDLARTKSLRLLSEELERRLRRVGGSLSAEQIKDLSKQLRTTIGRVTADWRSPNCTAYAIAEMTLTDFRFVIEGPRVSPEQRAALLGNTDTIIGSP